MPLRDRILQARDALQGGRLVNEAAVSTGVVLSLLDALGWPVFDTQIVAPEYTLEGRRVDYALCHPRTRPAVFVEVKQPGRSLGADRQLFEYAFHTGVPMAVLTDGREWHFYLPAEQGDYQERRVYRLDLLERDVEECERRFRRYLGYDAVREGEAYANARRDYQSIRREREAEAALPDAWRQLVGEEDERLVALLADRVESLSG
jgi:predicted type IV restriction endonuclease